MRKVYDEHSVTRTLLWSEEEKEEEGLTSAFRYSRTGELKQVVLPDGAELTINHDAAGAGASCKRASTARWAG